MRYVNIHRQLERAADPLVHRPQLLIVPVGIDEQLLEQHFHVAQRPSFSPGHELFFTR